MKTALQAVESRLKRFEELEKLLSDPAIAADPKQVRDYAKELSGLRPLAEKFSEYRNWAAQKASAEELASRETGELQQMARAELEELKVRLATLEKEIEV